MYKVLAQQCLLDLSGYSLHSNEDQVETCACIVLLSFLLFPYHSMLSQSYFGASLIKLIFPFDDNMKYYRIIGLLYNQSRQQGAKFVLF